LQYIIWIFNKPARPTQPIFPTWLGIMSMGRSIVACSAMPVALFGYWWLVCCWLCESHNV